MLAAQRVGQRALPEQHHSAPVRVGSGKMLGRAVHHEVRAALQGQAVEGRGQGVVHHQRDSVAPGEFADSPQVRNVSQRIGDCLRENQRGAVVNALFQLFQITNTHPLPIERPAFQNTAPQQSVSVGVERSDHDHLGTLNGAQGIQNHRDRCHAGRIQQGILRTVHFGENAANLLMGNGCCQSR